MVDSVIQEVLSVSETTFPVSQSALHAGFFAALLISISAYSVVTCSFQPVLQ